MYVVKVGEYYVRSTSIDVSTSEILLSNEIQRVYPKDVADNLANKLNGKVMEMIDQDTMDEEKYKQLSIFDEEVSNG